MPDRSLVLEDSGGKTGGHRGAELLALLDEGRLPRPLAEQRLLDGPPAQAGQDSLDAAPRAGAVAAGADIEGTGQALLKFQKGILFSV